MKMNKDNIVKAIKKKNEEKSNANGHRRKIYNNEKTT